MFNIFNKKHKPLIDPKPDKPACYGGMNNCTCARDRRAYIHSERQKGVRVLESEAGFTCPKLAVKRMSKERAQAIAEEFLKKH